MSKKSRQEYLDENWAFYSREYTWVLSEKAHFFASMGMILVYVCIAILVERMIFRCYYFRQAKLVVIDGLEVSDWVKQEVSASMWGLETWVIAGCGLLSITYILAVTLATKNYELYKYTFLISILPFAFMVIIGIFFVARIAQLGMFTWVSTSSFLSLLSAACTYIPLLLSVRSFVTAETRVRDTMFSEILECISKIISNGR